MAIVDHAELEFGAGLNVLTGETGAGKSIVLGALALLAGGRASARSVRAGAAEARVEGIFRTERIPDLEGELADRELQGDEHELVVHRTVTRAGRSRARVSGQLVPIATLTELFEGRLEISSQHESQALRSSESHGRLLDRTAGLLPRREAVAEGVREIRALDAEREALREAARERAQRQDFLEFQLREIEEAKLDPDEIEGLRVLRSRLAHAERLREDGVAGLTRLTGDPNGDSDPGSASRPPPIPAQPRLHCGGIADASGRNRREHHDVQRRQRRPARTAPLPRARSHRSRGRAGNEHARTPDPDHHLGHLPRLARRGRDP